MQAVVVAVSSVNSLEIVSVGHERRGKNVKALMWVKEVCEE